MEKRTLWFFYMDRIDMSPGFMSRWVVDYFHSYLNQIPKTLSHSSYNSRPEKD